MPQKIDPPGSWTKYCPSAPEIYSDLRTWSWICFPYNSQNLWPLVVKPIPRKPSADECYVQHFCRGHLLIIFWWLSVIPFVSTLYGQFERCVDSYPRVVHFRCRAVRLGFVSRSCSDFVTRPFLSEFSYWEYGGLYYMSGPQFYTHYLQI